MLHQLVADLLDLGGHHRHHGTLIHTVKHDIDHIGGHHHINKAVKTRFDISEHHHGCADDHHIRQHHCRPRLHMGPVLLEQLGCNVSASGGGAAHEHHSQAGPHEHAAKNTGHHLVSRIDRHIRRDDEVQDHRQHRHCLQGLYGPPLPQIDPCSDQKRDIHCKRQDTDGQGGEPVQKDGQAGSPSGSDVDAVDETVESHRL